MARENESKLRKKVLDAISEEADDETVDSDSRTPKAGSKSVEPDKTDKSDNPEETDGSRTDEEQERRAQRIADYRRRGYSDKFATKMAERDERTEPYDGTPEVTELWRFTPRGTRRDGTF